MAPTLFADKIYTATDLNRKSGELLSTAGERPITVVGGSSGAVVMQSRERAALHEVEARWLVRLSPVIAYFSVVLSDGTPSREQLGELGWVADLSQRNAITFLREFAAQLSNSTDTGDFDPLESLLEDWEATAEADADAELRRDLDEAKSDISRAVVA